ncbi:MAG: ATP-binding protein [Anaerolineales bacterium]
MILTVASGKGGTGKTTVATSLALAMADEVPCLLDCDVEAPNAHLLMHPEFMQQHDVLLPVPVIDEGRCSQCGMCAEVCQFNAIVMVGGKPMVFPELCHGCGSCVHHCPEQALYEQPRRIGILNFGRSSAGTPFANGVLDVGEALAVPVIRQLTASAACDGNANVIRDAPPGTSCPVVETLKGSDYALLVTEPTPFGLHDLKLAVSLCQELGLTVGVVINRAAERADGVEMYCRQAQIPILMRIPMDRHIAECLASGEALVEAMPAYRARFQELWQRVTELAAQEDPSLTRSAGGSSSPSPGHRWDR